MNKEAAYQALVEIRKKHQFPGGLLNPVEIEEGSFDSNQLGPWSRWQGNITQTRFAIALHIYYY